MSSSDNASVTALLLAAPSVTPSVLFLRGFGTVATALLDHLWATATTSQPETPLVAVHKGLEQFKIWSNEEYNIMLFDPLRRNLTVTNDDEVQKMFEEMCMVRMVEANKTLRKDKKRMVQSRVPKWREFVKMFMCSVAATSEVFNGGFFTGKLMTTKTEFLQQQIVHCLDTRIMRTATIQPRRKKRQPRIEAVQKVIPPSPPLAPHVKPSMVTAPAPAPAPSASPVPAPAPINLPPRAPTAVVLPPPTMPALNTDLPAEILSTMTGTGRNQLDELDTTQMDSVSVVAARAAAARVVDTSGKVVDSKPTRVGFASQAGSVAGSVRLANNVETLDAETVVSAMTRGVFELGRTSSKDNEHVSR